MSTVKTATSGSASRRAIRTIALIEAFKGIVVLLAATGALMLVHKDLNALAVELVSHAHLNPASRYPHIFLDAAAHLDEPRFLWLAAAAGAYSAIRLAEAYGLFLERAWAEWLAALSGGIYVPFEIAELVHTRSMLGLCVLAINIAIVGVMVLALLKRRRPARSAA